MALADLLSRYEEGRKSIADVLARQKQDIPASLDRTRGLVEEKRGDFFGNRVAPAIQATASKLGINPIGNSESRIASEGRLGRSLDRGLANRRRETSMMGVSQGFDQAFNEAVQAGLNEQNARDYAFKVSQMKGEQDSYASMAENSRQSALERERILDENSSRMGGIDAKNAYEPFSASDLVMAQLLGLGTAVGTGMAINKIGQKKSLPNSTISPGSYADRLQESFNRQEVKPYTTRTGYNSTLFNNQKYDNNWRKF